MLMLMSALCFSVRPLKYFWQDDKSQNKKAMNTKLIITIQIILATLALQLQAQQVWDLNSCVKYAIENNIDINIQKNQVIQQKVNLTESKAKLLPDLNLG